MSDDENVFDKGNLDSQDSELQSIYKDMAANHYIEPKAFQPKTMSSKSAFTPVKSRSETENPNFGSSENTFGSISGSGFHRRPSSFGTGSSSRGGMKKDQLAAQIKSFLGPDDPVVTGNSSTVAESNGEGKPGHPKFRKLPKSPDDERDRTSRTPTPENARNFSRKGRSRSRNSDQSPLRVTCKPPTGESSSLPRSVERNGKSPPDPARKKRTGSASRIPTPSSVNNASGNVTNNGGGATNSNPNPTLARRNSIGGSTGGTKIPTPIKRPSSLTVEDAHNRTSPKKSEFLQQYTAHAKDEPDSKLEFLDDFGRESGCNISAQGSKGQQEEDEATSSLSSGANDYRQPSVVRRHSPEKRSGFTIMPTIPATPKTPKTPKTPLEGSTHRCHKERNSRRSLTSPNVCQNRSDFEEDFDQDRLHPGSQERQVPLKATSAPSRIPILASRNTDDPRQGYVPKDTYRELLQNRKFRSKHAHLLTEAYEIIGKYFPEKRLFVQSFYSHPFESSNEFRQLPGSTLQNFDHRLHSTLPGYTFGQTGYSQMQPENFGGIQSIRRPGLPAGMVQPVVYLVPGSALSSQHLLRHSFGPSY